MWDRSNSPFVRVSKQNTVDTHTLFSRCQYTGGNVFLPIYDDFVRARYDHVVTAHAYEPCTEPMHAHTQRRKARACACNMRLSLSTSMGMAMRVSTTRA